MGRRVTTNVVRPDAIEVLVDGVPVPAHEGETLATVLLAAGRSILSRDVSGRLRSPFCNMGVCFDCMVDVESAGVRRRVRACLTAVRPGMQIHLDAASELSP